jgi:hypothetical protein
VEPPVIALPPFLFPFSFDMDVRFSSSSLWVSSWRFFFLACCMSASGVLQGFCGARSLVGGSQPLALKTRAKRITSNPVVSCMYIIKVFECRRRHVCRILMIKRVPSPLQRMAVGAVMRWDAYVQWLDLSKVIVTRCHSSQNGMPPRTKIRSSCRNAEEEVLSWVVVVLVVLYWPWDCLLVAPFVLNLTFMVPRPISYARLLRPGWGNRDPGGPTSAARPPLANLGLPWLQYVII